MQTRNMTKNQEKAQQYLSRIRRIEQELNGKRLEIEALRYKASGMGAIRYDKERVQATPQDSQDYMTLAINDAIELEHQIEEDEASIEDIKGQAYSIVRQMDTAEHRAFIEWYYLNGLSMSDTAFNMSMSERNVYYVQERALEEFGARL